MVKLEAFRIKHFRSVLDSNWVKFSPDGITVFVGQNESGKSSVLDALYFALSTDVIDDDDKRIGGMMPAVQLRVALTFSDIEEKLASFDSRNVEQVRRFLKQVDGVVELHCTWDVQPNGKLDACVGFSDAHVDKFIKALVRQSHPDDVIEALIDPAAPTPTTAVVEQTDKPEIDDGRLAVLIWEELPKAVRFNENEGHLPSNVSITKDGQPTGPGASAASNFLTVADVDLPELLKADLRARKSMMDKANAAISKDFNRFWSQTIGASGKLTFLCELENYGASAGENAGKPHLVFWVCDGSTRLYPKQRSQGVSWFISFYLQLRASEKRGLHRIFLFDEPGANLHIKAQADVLSLINGLRKESALVAYTTHSPAMIEYEKLYRVHAVQRDDSDDESPTHIIHAHELGTASSDTLSPILMAMGVDLSHQQVIKKTRNIILEEMSGYYYLTALWLLLKSSIPVHFIAATGADKIIPLVNMFIGWGLEFGVVLDDDKKGRQIFEKIKRHTFGDDEALAHRRIYRIRNCSGIEDIFTRTDFFKFVLETEPTGKLSNSEYMKTAKISKPVAAYNFALRVRSGSLVLGDLEKESQDRIRIVVDSITALINTDQ